MKKIEVGVLQDTISCPFLKLPTRQFPGILVQGDTYFIQLRTVEKALAMLSRGDEVCARELLDDLAEDLSAMLDLYETALSENDINLPYIRSAQEK